MGSKASVQTSIKELSRGERGGTAWQDKSSAASNREIKSPHERRNSAVLQERELWSARLEEKCRQITALTVENEALLEENQRLNLELEEFRTHAQNESNSLIGNSRLSLSSAMSCQSMYGDPLLPTSSSPWSQGSPWTMGNTLSPNLSGKSSTTDRRRRHLLPMSDIDAYGKGLNPNQSHFIIRTSSTGTATSNESIEFDELNGNTKE